MTHLVSPQELVIRDILDPVVRVQELHHAMIPNIPPVLTRMFPAVWLADCQKSHHHDYQQLSAGGRQFVGVGGASQ